MVDNALGTSVSGPLPEGIEERRAGDERERDSERAEKEVYKDMKDKIERERERGCAPRKRAFAPFEQKKSENRES